MSIRLSKRDVDPVKLKRIEPATKMVLKWDVEKKDILFEKIDIFFRQQGVAVTLVNDNNSHLIWEREDYLFNFGRKLYTWKGESIYLSKYVQKLFFNYFVEGINEPRMSMAVRNVRRKLGDEFLKGWHTW